MLAALFGDDVTGAGHCSACFRPQSIRSCAIRQSHPNLHSCSVKLLWVFKLTVTISNWNINLFRSLTWFTQWCITKYLVVSDLLRFLQSAPVVPHFSHLVLRVGLLSLPRVAPLLCHQSSLSCPPFLGFPPTLMVEVTDASLM